jgi:signal transduction histidine kinase
MLKTVLMGKGRKKAESIWARQGDQPFLQALGVALVCIVFVSLILVMGLVDLRNLDNTLVDDMENRGLATIRNVQQVAEYHFQQLVQSQRTNLYAETVPAFSDDAFSLQESLVIRLVELSRRIVSLWEIGKTNDKQLASLAAEENLWLVAFLDGQGSVIAKNRIVPEEVVRFAAPVLKGHEEIQINIFDQFVTGKGLGLIALPLKSREGAIIMAMEGDGFRYWSLKISIQKAIEEVGQGPGISHFTVTDRSGRTMGHSDTVVQDHEEFVPIERRTGDAGVLSRKTIIGGEHVLEIEVPLSFTAGFSGMARLGLSRERVYKLLKKEQTRVFIYMAFLVIIAFLAMWLLYKNQNRHLAKMREIERRLNQAEKLSALGRLAAGVAHEIRNPLNAISMASQRLQRDNLSQLIEVIRDEIRRLNKIIEDFLTFSKSRKLEFQRHDLIELVRQIVLLISDEAESKGVKIITDLGDSALMVSMDFDRLKQALFNIIKNAMESISDEGLVTVSVETGGKRWVNVRVSDTGNGLNPDETERIFDPDYTTKEKGLGLGLPLAHEIIRGHGGEIQVRSRKGSGSTFEILLPKNT